MQESGEAAERWWRRLRNDQLSGLFLIALALFIGWQNGAYPLGTLQEPGPGYLPLLLAGFMGAMGLLIALRGAKSPLFSSLRWPELKRAIVILVACGFGAIALERLGYRLTVLALLIFFLGVVERKNGFAVVAVAAGFSLISYFVFATWLRVPLPLGPWGF